MKVEENPFPSLYFGLSMPFGALFFLTFVRGPASAVGYLFGLAALMGWLNFFRTPHLPPLLETSAAGLLVRKPFLARQTLIAWSDLQSVEATELLGRRYLTIRSADRTFLVQELYLTQPAFTVAAEVNRIAAQS